MAPRRGQRVGLDLLRCRSHLIYYGTSNPGPVDSEPEAGRQQVDQHTLRPRSRQRQGALGGSVDAPRRARLRRRQREHPRRPADRWQDAQTPGALRPATRSPTQWTARPARSFVAKTLRQRELGQPRRPRDGRRRCVNADKNTTEGVNVTDICPPDIGGKDEQPAAYSPQTKLFYVPTNNMCMDYEAYEVSYIAGTPYWGAKKCCAIPGRGELRRIHRVGRDHGHESVGHQGEVFHL